MAAHDTVARIASAKAAGGEAAFSDVVAILNVNAGRVEVVAESMEALVFIALQSAGIRDSTGGLSIRLIATSDTRTNHHRCKPGRFIVIDQ